MYAACGNFGSLHLQRTLARRRGRGVKESSCSKNLPAIITRSRGPGAHGPRCLWRSTDMLVWFGEVSLFTSICGFCPGSAFCCATPETIIRRGSITCGRTILSSSCLPTSFYLKPRRCKRHRGSGVATSSWRRAMESGFRGGGCCFGTFCAQSRSCCVLPGWSPAFLTGAAGCCTIC